MVIGYRLLALAGAGLLGVGCATGAGQVGAPRSPGEDALAADLGQRFVIASPDEPESLSPLVVHPHHFPEHTPYLLLFDGLTQLQPDGSAGPKLAERWETSSDGLTYTFTLAPNAAFHDGTPVTAEDVKFTFDAMIDTSTGSSNQGVVDVVKTEALDPRTFRVALRNLSPLFLTTGGARGIVPRHAFSTRDLNTDEFRKHPVGSGPYKLSGYTPGQSIVMDAVSGYYRGRASIPRVVMQIVPDQNVILTQLRTGEVQYAKLTPRDLAAAQKLTGLQVIESKTPRFYDISINYAQRAFWGDKRVREAVLVGMNRQSIVDKVLLGHGDVIDANVAPYSWAYNPNITRHPYDAARARQLLDTAGWKPGSGGIRERDGEALRFFVVTWNSERTLEQSLIVAQQNLKEIGVQLDIRSVEGGVFNQYRREKNFDAFADKWNPVYDPDNSSQVRKGNFYGYYNQRADELVTQALTTLDVEARKKAYAEIQQILSDDVAKLYLYSENEMHALPASIGGVTPHPVSIFWNIKDWKIGK